MVTGPVAGPEFILVVDAILLTRFLFVKKNYETLA